MDLASKALDFSFEQILLPHAVIVLNNSPNDTQEWDDVEHMTFEFFSRLNVHWKEASLAKYLSHCKKHSRLVSNVGELLKYYYSSIRVIKIPNKERLMLVQKQASVLDREIQTACNVVYEYELPIREQKTTEEFHNLVKDAFNHFTSRVDRPFTRVPFQFRTEPISPDFKHHIVSLAKSVSGRYASGVYLSDFQIFLAIAPVVASCISIYCVRYGRPG